jgi:hypothetical protein
MEREMKTSDSRFEMQQRAVEALRSLLSQVSVIQLKEIRTETSAKSGKTCFVARIDVFGRRCALACCVISSSERKSLRASLLELRGFAAQISPETTPVLIAPYLSPEEQAVCRELNAAFLDLEGNARLIVDEVFIVRRNLRPHRTSTVTAPVFDSQAASPLPNSSAALIGLSRGGQRDHADNHGIGAVAVA